MPGIVRSAWVRSTPNARSLATSSATALVPAHEHAAFAGGDVLHRIEREAAGVAEQADVRAVAARAERDRAVLDDLQAVPRRHAP